MGLVLRLSDKCNNKCFFCKNYHQNSTIYTLEDINRLDDKKEEITITCESIISNNFFETLKVLKEKNKEITIETNGRIFLYQDIIDKIKKFNIKNINILILGSNENSYQRLTKIRDSFRQSLGGIKKIIKNNFDINAKIIITEENMAEAESLISLARKIKPKTITADFLLSDEYIEDRYKVAKYIYDKHKDIIILGADDELRILGIVYNRNIIGPSYLDIDITNKCNLNCNYCWDHSPLLKDSKKDIEWLNKSIDFELFKKIVLEAKEMRTQQIGFGGSGEPLLHPKVREMISFIKSQDMDVTICTNGILIDSDMSNFLAKNNVQLRVNISAGTKLTYEKTHSNNSDKFEMIKENLLSYSENLKSLHPKSKWEIINIITKDNYTELKEMVQLGIDTKCDEIHFMMMNTVEETKSLLIPNEEVKDFKLLIDETIEFEKSRTIWTNLRLLRDIVNTNKNSTTNGFYNYTEEISPEVGCYCSWYYNRIDSENCLNLCGELPIESSSIENGNMIKILNSELVKNIRTKIQDKNPKTMLEICKSCFEYQTNLMIHEKMKEVGAIKSKNG